jgi:hypothetical protein
MTYAASGAKRAIDSKEHNYPINSYCVKVGAFEPLATRYGKGSGSDLACPSKGSSKWPRAATAPFTVPSRKAQMSFLFNY